VRALGYPSGTIAVDEATPFFTFDGLRRAGNAYTFINSIDVTAGCRMIKSEHELALMQTAKNITLEAHKAAARIMREGITTTEVQAFITAAHRKLGSEGDPPFNAVLFGEATAYPHGVPYPQTLKDGDMILIDTGAPVDGYLSDITRSYVFGEPTKRQRDVWNLEKEAQAAGFAAAKPGNRCEDIDIAARGVINGAGFGPGYATPGLPHRTGHGIGLDVHEWPYLVKGDKTVLKPGMTFSNEPTICIYGEFGVRLEDHMVITETGARWFTQPAHSVDDPFGLEKYLQLLAGNYRCLTYNARGFPPSNVHEERRRHKAPIVHSRGDEGVACTSASTFVLGEDALINEVLNVAQGRVGRALLNCSPFARCQLALETVQRTIQHVALPIIDLCSGKPFPELRLFKHSCENGLCPTEGAVETA
jgi:Xaa-Pro aminopeptidase